MGVWFCKNKIFRLQAINESFMRNGSQQFGERAATKHPRDTYSRPRERLSDALSGKESARERLAIHLCKP